MWYILGSISKKSGYGYSRGRGAQSDPVIVGDGGISSADVLTKTRGPVNLSATQPCIPPGSLNRVPASAGVREGMSPLPGGR